MAKFSLDSSYVEVLAKILKEYDLREVSIGNKGARITIKRGEKTIYSPIYPQQHSQQLGHSAPPPTHAATAPAPTTEPTIAAETAAQSKEEESGVIVVAPVVGTVYLAPRPTDPPFVKIGAKIKEGQTLLIIEAMKIMNQIPAPCSGVIQKIHVDDAQPVEFGDALVIIEPS